MENIPPFYVGQKIVMIIPTDDPQYKVGDEFICHGIERCKKCQVWYVDIGTRAKRTGGVLKSLCHCGHREFMSEPIVWFLAKRFAPIEENFQSISLSKVLEEETKIISVN